MMFSPCGPSAVPTGGAGVAFPAGSCSLIVVCTFFGGMFLYPFSSTSYPEPRTARRGVNSSTQLLDGSKIQFYRRRTPENRHGNLQTAMVVVDVFHRAVEIRKRPVDDAHLFVALIYHFRLGSILRRVHAIDNRVHFTLCK